MRNNFVYSLIFIFTFSFFSDSFAWNPFKKQTYEDCILENMKGVTNDDAASEIKFACESKTYKENSSNANSKKCVKRFLTAEETKMVTANAVVESYGWLKVKVYNGNNNISITEVKVRIIDKETQKSFDFNMSNATVNPISTSGEMLAQLLYVPKKWEWYVLPLATEVCK